MRHASLFSGIGGPEVAAAMMGWENAFHCEINPFGRAVLDYWFPESKSYEDITKTSFKEWRGRIDVLTGGFPCQPFSYAGKRGGRDDDRYLWPEMLRVIDEVRPTWVVGENVAGITTMVEGGVLADLGGESTLFAEGDGLHRYQLDQSFTLERICRDLEGIGYSVQPMLVPAAGVGAPHRRDRVFILAHDDAHHPDLRADDRPAGEDEGAEGEERIPQRDNLHLVGDPSEVRSEVQRSAEDTERVRWGGGVTEGEPRVGGLRVSRAGGDERVCCEEGTDASDPGRFGQRASGRSGGREGETDSEERRHNPLAGSLRSRPSRAPSHTDGGGCDAQEAGGSEQEVGGVLQEQGERGFPPQRTDGLPPVPRDAAHPERRGSGTLPAPVHSGVADGDESLRVGCVRSTTHPVREGLEGEDQSGDGEGGERVLLRGDTPGHDWAADPGLLPGNRWAEFPTVPPIHRGNDGIPIRLDNLSLSFSKWRTESLKAYGNAIVPQVMYRLFQAIETAENQTTQ